MAGDLITDLGLMVALVEVVVAVVAPQLLPLGYKARAVPGYHSAEARDILLLPVIWCVAQAEALAKLATCGLT